MSGDRPYFSVIVPVHNRADTIGATLDSIQSQDWRDFECIVVDDGSDDEDRLSQTIDARKDARILCIRRPNGGGGAARNTGIAAARGRYIAFLDSDDLFVPAKLSAMARVVSDRPMVIWYSTLYIDRGGGRFWSKPDRPIAPCEDVGEYLFAANQVIPTSSMVMSRETAAAIGFEPNLRKGQDLDFCVRAQAHGARFEMIDLPLGIWTDRDSAGRVSHTRGAAQLEQWLEDNASLLTPKARAGYRATVLAYFLSREKPLIAARDLLAGLGAGIAPAVLARQALRCFLPQSVYRALVNVVISLLVPARISPRAR